MCRAAAFQQMCCERRVIWLADARRGVGAEHLIISKSSSGSSCSSGIKSCSIILTGLPCCRDACLYQVFGGNGAPGPYHAFSAPPRQNLSHLT